MWLLPCKSSCVMNQLQFILHPVLLEILSPGCLWNLSTLFWHLNYFGSLEDRNSLEVKAKFIYCAFLREVMAWPQWLCLREDSVLSPAMQWNAGGETEDTIWGQEASKGPVQAPREQVLRKDAVPTISSGRYQGIMQPCLIFRASVQPPWDREKSLQVL